jgi:hypothetical protein
MKKTVALLVVIIIASGAYAQGIRIGAKGGLNLSGQIYRADDYSRSSPGILPSYHIGGYVTFKFSEVIGLQPELLFSVQGSKSSDVKLKLSYINVPVMVRFDVSKVLSFHAGPQFGILASAKREYSGDETDVKDDYKSLELAGAIGATVDLPFGLNFTGRFVKGLSNTISEPGANNNKERNFTLQLSVGFTFLKKGDK